MQYVKIGLDDLTVPAQIQSGRRLINGLTGNTHLPNPNPSIAALTAATDALETAFNDAQAARLAAKTKTQLLEEQVAAFAATVSLLASYVDNASGATPPSSRVPVSAFAPRQRRSDHCPRRRMCRRSPAIIPAMWTSAGARSTARKRTTSNAPKTARN
jgi:hypothetical protein